MVEARSSHRVRSVASRRNGARDGQGRISGARSRGEMTLEFTAGAVSEFKSIRAYTLEKWGAKQEQVYLDSLWAKFEEIVGSPNKWRARDDLFLGCRIA